MLTDLAITGKPAQFGRGVMQDVSDKLLGQFVACLESRLAGGAPEAPGEPPPAAPELSGAPEAEPADAGPPAAAAPTADPAPSASAPPPRHAAPSPPPPPPQQDEALNLGATVLPVLAKSYWKQALAGVIVVGVIIWLIGRG